MAVIKKSSSRFLEPLLIPGDIMQQDINKIFSAQYPSSVKDAVRYGYLYRKESEVVDSNCHFSLPEASAILLWIASAVASGIIYDVIKENVKHLLSCLKEAKHKLDKKTKEVIEDEDALKEFTIYIEEYYSHDMKITIEQEEYIKEEMIADTTGEEATKIFEETGRIVLTKEERIRIDKIAYGRAEELIHRHK